VRQFVFSLTRFELVNALCCASTLASTAAVNCGENWNSVKYIYTDSQHKNPLCRVLSLDNNKENNGKINYDKEKYREMMLDAAETVLGYFGFDRTVYGNKRNTATRKSWWLEELRQEREKDIMIEMVEGKR
jgi:hypothetical protein